jgi:hypothetical protein
VCDIVQAILGTPPLNAVILGGVIMDEKSWKIKMLSSQNVKCA